MGLFLEHLLIILLAKCKDTLYNHHPCNYLLQTIRNYIAFQCTIHHEFTYATYTY